MKQNLLNSFQNSTKEVEELEEDLLDVETLRLELADFFCEDPPTFQLEECFKTLRTFCERFQRALQVRTGEKLFTIFLLHAFKIVG